MKKYVVQAVDGRRWSQLIRAEALDLVAATWPGCVMHDDGARILVWACEADARDDDGRRAVASIYPMGGTR